MVHWWQHLFCRHPVLRGCVFSACGKVYRGGRCSHCERLVRGAYLFEKYLDGHIHPRLISGEFIYFGDIES